MLDISSINSTAYLLGAFGVIDTPSTFLLDVFFPIKKVFETREIYFDVLQRARGLAPFNAPEIAAKPERARGYSSAGLKAPYVKSKHVITPSVTLNRRPGENLLGNISPLERLRLGLLDNIKLEKDSVIRLEEKIAADLLLYSAAQIGDYNTENAGTDALQYLVTNRPVNQTLNLHNDATYAWSVTGVDPYENLIEWGNLVADESGYFPNIVIMGNKAAQLYSKSPGALRVMQSFRQMTGDINLTLPTASGAVGNEVRYIGNTGDFQIYAYQQYYADKNGAAQKMIPDYAVIMGNVGGAGGVRAYGAIQDFESLIPLDFFPKAWVETGDVSAYYSMIQSAPLPVLAYPKATFAAIVN